MGCSICSLDRSLVDNMIFSVSLFRENAHTILFRQRIETGVKG